MQDSDIFYKVVYVNVYVGFGIPLEAFGASCFPTFGSFWSWLLSELLVVVEVEEAEVVVVVVELEFYVEVKVEVVSST